MSKSHHPVRATSQVSAESRWPRLPGAVTRIRDRVRAPQLTRCPLQRADSPTGRQGTFGPPAFFDLTTLQRPQPPAPTVYYLVPEVPTRDQPATWRTVLGFGAVIGGGLSLGLLLVLILL